MTKFKNIALSLAAGLLGGMISHYVWTPAVHAQTLIPKEIRAQSFILMNEKGDVGGKLGFDDKGKPAIALYSQGRLIWRTGDGNVFKPLGN